MKRRFLPVIQLVSCLFAFACLAILAEGAAAGAIPGGPSKRLVGSLVRSALTQMELSQSFDFQLGLNLRNYDELRARIAKGEVLSVQEMRDRYLPTEEQWKAVADWATQQGFVVRPVDGSRMTVFASGTVSRVQAALKVQFARVWGTDGQEHTSAVTEPELPSAIAPYVFRVRNLKTYRIPRPAGAASTSPVIAPSYVSPKYYSEFYNASTQGLDGTGQTIIILGSANPSSDDLTTFWSKCGLPTTLSQYTSYLPTGFSWGTDYTNALENTMDVEAASAMAPGANIIMFGSVDAAHLMSWLLSAKDLSLKDCVVSESYGTDECLYRQESLLLQPFDTPYYATMAALGISLFASSGDHGSNYNPDVTNAYGSTGPLSVLYPGSDPYVIAVGGTANSFDIRGQTIFSTTEGAWTLPTWLNAQTGSGYAASTGGYSEFFARQSWQTGSPLMSDGRRCVPDVAAVASGSFYIRFRGNDQSGGGTSLSAPVWAGLCADLKQGLKARGASLGFLPARLYRLMGTTVFHQITTGTSGSEVPSSAATNGAYPTGVNYNLISGLGSPDIGNLLTALLADGSQAPVSISTPPQAVSVACGQTARFTVQATGGGTLAYQWLISGTPVQDGGHWTGATLSGCLTSQLTIQNVTTPLNNAEIRVIVSNTTGSQTTVPVTMAVTVPDGAPVVGPLKVNGAAPSPFETARGIVMTALAAGSPATLSVTASGGSLSYQWYRDGSALPGATGATLSLASVQPADKGNYVVTVSNPSGMANSQVLDCTVATLPVIVLQPADMNATSGGDAYAYCDATASGNLTYTWQVSTDGGATWSDVSANATYSFTYPNRIYMTAVGVEMGGNKYRCRVSTAAGSAYSNPALLVVSGTPLFTTQPANQGYQAGDNLSLTVTVAGGPTPTCRWQVSTDGGTTWTAVADGQTYAGSATTTLTINAAASGMNGYQYRCVATNSNGSVNSGTATLMLGARAPVFTTQPVDTILAAGANGTLTAVADGQPAPSCQWSLSTDGGSTWSALADGDVYSGSATDTLTVLAAKSSMNGYRYECVASNSVRSTTSAAAVLTIDTPVTLVTQPVEAVVTPGSSAGFTTSWTGNPVPTLQWQVSTDGGLTWTTVSDGGLYSGATSSLLSIGSTTSDMCGYLYRCVGKNPLNTVTSEAAKLGVGTAASIQGGSWQSTVWLGQAATFSVNASGDPAVSYQWQFSTDDGATWADLADGGTYSGAKTKTLTIAHVTADMDGVQFQCVVSNAINSAVTSWTMKLAVQVPVTIETQPQDEAVSPGATARFSVSATARPLPGYRWQVSTDQGNTWNDVADGGAYSGSATNALSVGGVTTAMDGYEYRCVVSNTSGSITTYPARLTVQVPVAITTQPQAKTAADGAAASFSVSATGTPSPSFRWQVSTDQGKTWNVVTDGGAYSGSATNALSVQGATASMDGYEYRCVVSNLSGSKTTDAVVLTVLHSQILDLSVRAVTHSQQDPLIVGFVSKDSTDLVLRCTGPALSDFGVTGYIADPYLQLYGSGAQLEGSDDDWTQNADSTAAQFQTAFKATGLFGYDSAKDPKEAAMLLHGESGLHSAYAYDAKGLSGVCLVELFNLKSGTGRFTSVSARNFAGAGDQQLIAGFTIDGNAPETVLIRAVGPTLTAFKVEGVMKDPKLELYRIGAGGVSTLVATNDNWADNAAGVSVLQAAFSKVLAFNLPTDSKDAVLLMSLDPGVYTANVTSVDGGSGQVLIEVYEVP